MPEETTTSVITPAAPAPVSPVGGPVVAGAPVASAVKPAFNRFNNKGGRPPFNSRRPGGRPGAPKSDLEQKVLSIRRVARVIAGGKRFTFSVCLAAGDKKGRVGVGMAKAGGTSEAIDKALRDARKNLIQVNVTKDMSIPHEVEAKYCAAVVVIRPAKGRGLIAGSAPRVVLALAGITDTNAKILSGSKNKVNNARATIEALKKLR